MLINAYNRFIEFAMSLLRKESSDWSLRTLSTGLICLTILSFMLSQLRAYGADKGRITPAPIPAVLPPQVKIAAILQTRGIIISQFKKPYIDALNSKLGLRFVLEVTGSAFVDPQGISNLHLYAKSVEGGGRLQLISPVGPAMLKIDSHLYATMQQDGAIGFPVVLRFAPAPPLARKLRHLTGSFDVLYGGTTHAVQINNLAAMAGKEVENTQLSKWHIHVSILPAHTADKSTFLTILIHGPADCFRSLQIKQGKSVISHGYFSAILPNQTVRVMVPLQQPPVAATSLVLNLMVNQKKKNVRFHFAHVALP